MKCLRSCGKAAVIWTSDSDTLWIQAAIHKCKPFGVMTLWAVLDAWLNVNKASSWNSLTETKGHQVRDKPGNWGKKISIENSGRYMQAVHEWIFVRIHEQPKDQQVPWTPPDHVQSCSLRDESLSKNLSLKDHLTLKMHILCTKGSQYCGQQSNNLWQES